MENNIPTLYILQRYSYVVKKAKNFKQAKVKKAKLF